MGAQGGSIIRAVLDTNVVISALIFPGPANVLAEGWQQRRFTFLVSKALLGEYLRVLHYPKFQLTEETIRGLLTDEVLPFVTPVRVRRTPRVIQADPSDDHVLACAVSGKAHVIVSGDHHVLTLGRYRRIPIVSLKTFLQALKQRP